MPLCRRAHRAAATAPRGRSRLAGCYLAWLALLLLLPAATPCHGGTPPLLTAPIWVYNNWSAYDELSDDVPLTEELAMRELSEILRLRELGVRFDYYMMDAFWFDPDGGYRKWRADSWPGGPDRWIEACKANGVEPGLWFSTNTLTHMRPAPQWHDSLAKGGDAMAMYRGGFLADFIDVLQYWYDRGIRLFKFDMADFAAAVAGDEETLTQGDIRRRNERALHGALKDFRRANPDIVLVAFNGIVGDVGSARGTLNPFNERWLDVFDSLYSGDPRPSNAPQMEFARSVDIYSDYMVRHFADSGIPLSRVDSTSVMLGDTGTNYHRKTDGWQGSLLLMVAHGGWVNTVHGNLEYLDHDMARWFARVQSLYAPLQQAGVSAPFGGAAGDLLPYGFASAGTGGALYAVVNPAQRVQSVRLPHLTSAQGPVAGGRVLFRDAGFAPTLDGHTITLGAGQLALVGTGRYASPAYDLGVQRDVRIPRSIAPIAADFREQSEPGAETARPAAPQPVEAVVLPPAAGDLRILMQQRDAEGRAMRSVSKAAMGTVLQIAAWQDGRRLPVEIGYDKVIWTGLSWAAGEIRHGSMAPGRPIRIRLSSADPDPELRLEGRLYRVEY